MSTPVGAELRRIALGIIHPLGPLGAHAIGQAANLGTQTLLLAALGTNDYTSLGLALITATMIAFLGELGYPVQFLRAAARGDGWHEDWRVSVFHRLLALGAGQAAACAFWIATAGPMAGGTLFLAGALPGVLASAFNMAPLLYGAGRPRAAASGSLVRWSVHAAGMLAVAWAGPGPLSGLYAGLAFSAGWLAQSVWYAGTGLPLRLFAPLPGLGTRTVSAGALALWAVSLVGAVQDRALPYAVAALHPELLVGALLAMQLLQGLASLIAQSDRVVLPFLAAKAEGSRAALSDRLQRLMMAPVTVLAVFMATAVVLLDAHGRLPAGALAPALLLLLEWTFASAGQAQLPAALARARDVEFAKAVGGIIVAGLAAQGVLVLVAPLPVVQAARLVATILALWFVRRLTGVPVPAELFAGVGGVLATLCAATVLPGGAASVAALALAAAVAAGTLVRFIATLRGFA